MRSQFAPSYLRMRDQCVDDEYSMKHRLETSISCSAWCCCRHAERRESRHGSLKTMPPRRLWVGLPCSSYQGAAEAGELFTFRSDFRRSEKPPPGERVGAEPVCFWWAARRRPDRRDPPLTLRPGLSSRTKAAAPGRIARLAVAFAAPPKETRCRAGLSRSWSASSPPWLGLREL